MAHSAERLETSELLNALRHALSSCIPPTPGLFYLELIQSLHCPGKGKV